MKLISTILSLILFFCFSLKADDTVRERVYIHTDKNCYIAGENIWLKFYVIDSNFQPSLLSKVGYIEICDTEMPRIQLKVALEKGSGAGKMKIPSNLPTGIYRLTGYTRYMRNEGEKVLFEKQIAIINAKQQTPDPVRFNTVESFENLKMPEKALLDRKEPSNLMINTDRKEYGNRKKVIVSLDNIPENTANLVISVSRTDSIAFVPEINKQEWLKQVKGTFDFSHQWIPEYEGHIINCVCTPKPNQQLISNISIVGKDIRYFNGKLNYENGLANFYTSGLSGKQQIVTSVVSSMYNKAPYRLDLISPFYESLPLNLPALQIYMSEKQLIERYLGVQIQEKTDNDSIEIINQPSNHFAFQPFSSYDLDEYTRFSSISETILEFVNLVRVSKVGNTRKIRVYLENEQRFSIGNTLVLIDGVPLYDHEEILAYNPMYIKKINIYDGRYLFGGEYHECIVSFITHDGNLPFFKLTEGSQLFDYDCPQLPQSLVTPDYSTDEFINSRKPDFRHTLYWNPDVEYTKGQTVNLSFYTSDLCGEFKVTVEGITTDGKLINGNSSFHVSEDTN